MRVKESSSDKRKSAIREMERGTSANKLSNILKEKCYNWCKHMIIFRDRVSDGWNTQQTRKNGILKLNPIDILKRQILEALQAVKISKELTLGKCKLISW